MGQMMNTHNVVVGKLKTSDEPRKSARKLTARMEDNTKMGLMETGYEDSSSGSTCGPISGSCDYDNDPSAFIQARHYLDQVSY
jgi:hypothetical protein